MIVLGAHTRERSHTIAAAATGEVRGEQTAMVGSRGFAALLSRARVRRCSSVSE